MWFYEATRRYLVTEHCLYHQSVRAMLSEMQHISIANQHPTMICKLLHSLSNAPVKNKAPTTFASIPLLTSPRTLKSPPKISHLMKDAPATSTATHPPQNSIA